MNEFWKIIQVILLSSVKFVAGPPFAYFDNRYNFTFFETVLYSVIGGMLGVVIFTFFSRWLFGVGNWIKHYFKKVFHKKEIFSEPMADIPGDVEVKYNYLSATAAPRKLFTRRNRSIVRVWLRHGLFGIALITPIILSIPLGTLIANSLVSDRRKIMLYMFFSILFWSVLMTSLFELYHAVNMQDLRQHLNL